MALDASAPIRHKGFASHIDGIGPTLAVVFQDDISRKQVEDLITSGILKQWLLDMFENRSGIHFQKSLNKGSAFKLC